MQVRCKARSEQRSKSFYRRKVYRESGWYHVENGKERLRYLISIRYIPNLRRINALSSRFEWVRVWFLLLLLYAIIGRETTTGGERTSTQISLSFGMRYPLQFYTEIYSESRKPRQQSRIEQMLRRVYIPKLRQVNALFSNFKWVWVWLLSLLLYRKH